MRVCIEVLHKFAKLRNSAIMEENVRFCRGDSLYNSNVFFHNGGKLRNLAFVKDLYRFFLTGKPRKASYDVANFFFRERSEDSFMVGRFLLHGRKIPLWSEDSSDMVGRFPFGDFKKF